MAVNNIYSRMQKYNISANPQDKKNHNAYNQSVTPPLNPKKYDWKQRIIWNGCRERADEP